MAIYRCFKSKITTLCAASLVFFSFPTERARAICPKPINFTEYSEHCIKTALSPKDSIELFDFVFIGTAVAKTDKSIGPYPGREIVKLMVMSQLRGELPAEVLVPGGLNIDGCPGPFDGNQPWIIFADASANKYNALEVDGCLSRAIYEGDTIDDAEARFRLLKTSVNTSIASRDLGLLRPTKKVQIP